LELPNYRMPGIKNVGRLLWDKAEDFLRRAFTVIFLATLVIWFLQSFSPLLAPVSHNGASMLALLAGALSPVFAPMGFGDWRIVASLITGLTAKESVVSTLNVLFGSKAALTAALSPLSAVSLLVFTLLYTPCVAAIAAVRRELGARWALGIALGQCLFAWICALIVYLAGALFGL
jgi:ferrous iron transport protein B